MILILRGGLIRVHEHYPPLIATKNELHRSSFFTTAIAFQIFEVISVLMGIEDG
jgi:hypothetical protein